MRVEEVSATASYRSMPPSPRASLKGSPRSQGSLARLHDLASPVRPRSMHGSRHGSPGRPDRTWRGTKGSTLTADIVHQLEQHDEEQVCLKYSLCHSLSAACITPAVPHQAERHFSPS